MSFTAQDKEQIIKDHQKSTGDTGSAEVQIALLTARIKSLTEHFKLHKKDNHSRRGLIRLVNLRRKLLTYLKTNDIERYRAIIKRLGLRG